MDVRHFNRPAQRKSRPVPPAAPVRFEDALLGGSDVDHNAAYALDPALDSFGDRAFMLVPGVKCCPTDDGGMYLSPAS